MVKERKLDACLQGGERPENGQLSEAVKTCLKNVLCKDCGGDLEHELKEFLEDPKRVNRDPEEDALALVLLSALAN